MIRKNRSVGKFRITEVIRFETENICFTSLHNNPHINVFFCPSHQLNDIQSVLHCFTCKYVYNPHVNGPFCPSQLSLYNVYFYKLPLPHQLSTDKQSPCPSLLYRYSQTCQMWPSKGTVNYGHRRQEVVTW